jgi:hypothetical protein
VHSEASFGVLRVKVMYFPWEIKHDISLKHIYAHTKERENKITLTSITFENRHSLKLHQLF